MKKDIWSCTIGECDDAILPPGADLPMRRAVWAAYLALTGQEPTFLFSGWGSTLTETQRDVVDNNPPRKETTSR